MERIAETALRAKTAIAGAEIFAGKNIIPSLPVTVVTPRLERRTKAG